MNTTCPVCRATEVREYSGFTQRVWDKDYSLAQCAGCGSAFTSGLPDDATLEKFYRSSFDYRWYRDHLPAKLCDSEIRVREYSTLLGKRVLDFGGGLGYFSQVARAHGYDSTTYDPFAGAGSLPENGWDTLVALHVLEHANDLDRFCSHVKSVLAPGGRIILATPNFSGLGYRTFGMRWVWAQPPLMHIFHFTAKGLEALLKRHGFRDIEVSYHERWDANTFCDIKHVASTRRWDAAWGVRPLSTIPLFRKLVAIHNTRRRFRGLEKALEGYDKSSDVYSELQITAILPRTK